MASQNGWLIRRKPIKMDDLGVPLFQETTICFIQWQYDLAAGYLRVSSHTVDIGGRHVSICCDTPWYSMYFDGSICIIPGCSTDVLRWWEEETRWPGHLLSIAVYTMDAAVAYWFAEAIPSFPLRFFSARRGQVIQVLVSVFEHDTCSKVLSLVKNGFK